MSGYLPLGDNPEDAIRQEATRFGLRLHSGLRSPAHNAAVGGSPTSTHLKGVGEDYIGDPKQMGEFTKYMNDVYGPQLHELYYDPVGGFRNGNSVGAIGKHSDHVHVAWGSGGAASGLPPITDDSDTTGSKVPDVEDLFSEFGLNDEEQADAGEPVKIGVTQAADQPALGGDVRDTGITRAAQFARNNYRVGGSVDTTNLAARLKNKEITPEQALAELEQDARTQIGVQAGLTPEESQQFLRAEQVTGKFTPEEKLKQIESGQYAYSVPSDVPLRLQTAKRFADYDRMTPDEKEAEAYRIARTRPLTEEEKQHLGYAGGLMRSLGNYAQTFSTGMAEPVAKGVAGVGRIAHIPKVEQAGKRMEEAAQERLNIVKPPGVGGELARGTGSLLTDVAGSEIVGGGAGLGLASKGLEMTPAATRALHQLYWGINAGTEAAGSGATPEQAFEQAAKAIAILSANKPLAPLVGELNEGLMARLAKGTARVGLGGAAGYGMARAEGATPESAIGQAIQFGGMNILGGRRAPEEHERPIPTREEQGAMPRYLSGNDRKGAFDRGEYEAARAREERAEPSGERVTPRLVKKGEAVERPAPETQASDDLFAGTDWRRATSAKYVNERAANSAATRIANANPDREARVTPDGSGFIVEWRSKPAPVERVKEQTFGQETATETPKASTARPPSVEPHYGATTDVHIPGEDKTYPAQYVVHEGADLQPSHNPLNFEPNAKYEHRNDRDYSDKTNAMRVIDYAQNLKPGYVVGESPDAVNGATITDKNQNALGGNNRLMAIQRAYAMHPEKGTQYRDALIRNAERLGLDPKRIETDFTQPILSRELIGKHDAQKAITDFNKTGTAGNSEWDVTPLVSRAVDAIQEARAHGIKNLDDLRGQNAFIKGMEFTPQEIAVAKVLQQNPTQAARTFKEYAADEAMNRPGATMSMFGTPTHAEAFERAFGVQPPEEGRSAAVRPAHTAEKRVESKDEDGPERVITSTDINQFRDRNGAVDAGRFADHVATAVDEALKAGKSVSLVLERGARRVEITAVNRGMMQDAEGQRWGTFPVMQGDARVEIAAARETKYKFGSTQVNLPSELSADVLAMGKKIPDADLAPDGRETDPHITVKYGLHGDNADELRTLLADEKPITVRLGKTSSFKGVEGGTADAVIAEADSPDLHRLNKKIADALPHTDTYPDYKPHATIAYVKPGLGEKYAGRNDLQGKTATIDRIVFSSKSGEQVEIPLRGQTPAGRAGQKIDLTPIRSATAETLNQVVGKLMMEGKTAADLKAIHEATRAREKELADEAKPSSAGLDVEAFHQARNDPNTKVYPGELEIGKASGLDAQQQDIEARAAHKLESDVEGHIAEYVKRHARDGVLMLNTDDARELFPDWADEHESRALHVQAIQEPASSLVKAMWQRALKEPGRTNTVAFTAGGGGSGKTTAIKTVSELRQIRDNADIVFDTTMSGLGSSSGKVEEALKAGKLVDVIFTYTPTEKATVQAFGRAIKDGRTVPDFVLAADHFGAPRTFLALADKYKDDPRLNFHVVDNSGGIDDIALKDIDFLRQKVDNEREGQAGLADKEAAVRKAIDDEYARREAENPGSVPAHVYKGFRGTDPEPQSVRSEAGRNDSRGTEDRRSEGTGQEVARANPPPTHEPPELVSGTRDLIKTLKARFDSGEGVKDNPTLTRLADEAFKGTRARGTYTSRDAYDTLETALNLHLAERAPELLKMDPGRALAEVKKYGEMLPRQADRTNEQEKFQQFSTPPTLAYLVAKAADIKPGEIVVEPSAGTGNLALWARAAGGRVHTNEISDRREALLREQGYDTSKVNGEHLHDILPKDVKPSVIVMNPPFSATGGRVAVNKNKYGYNHITSALQRLEPGGRLVAILGEGAALDKPKAAGFWNSLMGRYNVRANIGLDGKDYGKFGTTFDNQVIIIDKTGPTPGGTWAEKLENIRFGKAGSLENALRTITDIASERTSKRLADVDSSDRDIRPGAGTGRSETGSRRRPNEPDRQPGLDFEMGAADEPGDRRPTVQATESANRPTEQPEPGGRVQGSGGPATDVRGKRNGSEVKSGPLSDEDLAKEILEQWQKENGITPAPADVSLPAPEPTAPRARNKSAKDLEKQIARVDKEIKKANQKIDFIYDLGPGNQKRMEDAERERDALYTQRSELAAQRGGGTPESPPTPREIRAATTEQKVAAAKSARADILKQLRAHVDEKYETQRFSGPGAPDIKELTLMVQLARTYIDQGVAKFSEAAQNFLEDFGEDAHRLGRTFEIAWNRLRGESPHIDEAGSWAEATAPKKSEAEDVSYGANPRAALREPESGGVFVTYQPAKLIGGTDPPARIVEAATMAAADPPDITYRPKLPRETMRDHINNASLETVHYAGQQHETTLPSGERAGYFTGDGTGVGKGRQLAGIMFDNFNQGRKRTVWVSAGADLIADAQRDIKNIGAAHIPTRLINDIKLGTDIEDDGVVFTTYSSLVSRSKDNPNVTRLSQLEKWLGDDGVIMFDEAHKAKNLLGVGPMGRPTQQAQAVVDIQDHLPNARVVYASATGATDVRNMAYMTRLGLWGEGTPFRNFYSFLSEIDARGLGAMETVARDMKALGKYNARTLSFNGVEYREVTHEMTPEQRKMYNIAADSWQVAMQDIEAALGVTNGAGSPSARFAASRFWGDHQRFFRQMLTALKIPTLLKEMEQHLAEGRSVVVSLKGTGAARQEALVARQQAAGGDLEDLDFTPREILANMVDSAFPTILYEDSTNPATGALIKVPVLDADGNPVHSQEALAMKQALLDRLSDLQLPENPLDQIVNHFGPDKVAEMTGRKKRVGTDASGKRVVMKRAPEGVAQAKANLAENKAFQDGKKRIAIISQAASTGISLHADAGAKNQQRRVQIALELGWAADSELQTMGRTHRNNQTSAPIQILMSTDAGGEKRFSSTLARRLASLGALGKGDRTAAGGGEVAKYNFETREGSTALTQLYQDILQGRLSDIQGYDGRQALRDMGVLKERPDGSERINDDDLTNVTRFFNRILALDLDRQNGIFDQFTDRFERQVELAKETGAFDDGVSDLKAEAVRVKGKPQTVYSDPRSGARTEYTQLEADIATAPVSFENAMDRDGEFYRSDKTGKVFFAQRSGSQTDAAGNVTRTWALTWPEQHRGRYIPESELSRLYTLIPDPKDAEEQWRARYEAAPKVRTHDVHLLTGVTLPLWDRLPGGRVVRTMTEDGQRLVGMQIPNENVARVLADLGISSGPVRTPDEIFRAVQEQGAAVPLTAGLAISRSSLHGEPAIEVTGAQSSQFDTLRGMGLINEKIDWRQRFFIPTEPTDGPGVIGKLLERFPARGGGESGSVAVDLLGAPEIVQGAKEVADTFKSARTAWRKVFNPSRLGGEARATSLSLRENLSRMQQSIDQVEFAMEAAHKLFAKMPPDMSTEIWDRAEHGRRQATPELTQIVRHVRQIMDDDAAQVRALGTGKLDQFIENYMPRYWDKSNATPAAMELSRAGKRPMEGRKSFTKPRTYEFFKDGLDAGETPLSTNPIDYVIWKHTEMQKYIAAHEALNEMKDEGTAVFARSPSSAPAGWVTPNDNLFARWGRSEAGERVLRGHYYVPAEAAQVINNYTSKGLRGEKWFRGYLTAANALNQMQLGFSFFHAGFVSLDAMISNNALAIYKAAHPGSVTGIPRAIGGAILTAAQSPIAPFLYAYQGRKITSRGTLFGRKVLTPGAWYDPASHPELAPIMDALNAGGGRARMDSFYRTNITERMVEAFKRGTLPGLLGGILRIPFAAAEVSMKPVMDRMVPAMKAGAIMKMAEFELSRFRARESAGEILQREEVRDAMAKIVDSVDNRMGQLIYDNLFWNKTAKDLGMASVRSLGWNLGDIRELGGGAVDTLANAKNLTYGNARALLKGESAKGLDVTHRMAYLLALPVTVGLIGGLMHKLMTGQNPDEPKDYFYPATGTFDDKGNPERVSLPSYMKDIYPVLSQRTPGRAASTLGHMAIHKLNPLLNTIGEMISNEDYYGVEIRHADDPLMKQAKDVANHLAKGFTPFAVRGVMKLREGGASLKEQAAPMIGITPAPRHVNQTAAVEMAEEKRLAKMPSTPRTQEQAERSRLKSDLANLVRRGKVDEAAAQVREAIKSGKLSESDAKEIENRGSMQILEYNIKKLSLSDSLDVYFDPATTPQEKRRIAPLIQDKADRFQPERHTPDEIKILKPRVLKFLQSSREAQR